MCSYNEDQLGSSPQITIRGLWSKGPTMALHTVNPTPIYPLLIFIQLDPQVKKLIDLTS